MNKKRCTGCYWFLITLLALLVGCSSSPVVTESSSVLVKPTQKYSELKLLYLDRKLGWQSGKQDPNLNLQLLGYNKLPTLLERRVPTIFEMNGLKAEFSSVAGNNFGPNETIQAARWSQSSGTNTPVLIMGAVDGSSWDSSKRNGSQLMFVTMQAELLDYKSRQRLWRGRFENSLSFSPGGKKGFDQDHVDQLLKTLLEQLSKDGMIALQDNTAKIPAPRED